MYSFWQLIATRVDGTLYYVHQDHPSTSLRTQPGQHRSRRATPTATPTATATRRVGLRANFSARLLTGTMPRTVTFTDVSVGEVLTRTWDFGDGHRQVASDATTTHVYTAAGVYTVRLTVEGPDGSDTLTRPNYIAVTSSEGGLRLEVGTVSGVGSSDYVTVTLAHSYEAMVVIATAPYSNNTLPLLTRVRNAQGNSFQVKLQNPSAQTLQPETVHYLVMEAGAYTLPDSRAIEAHLVDSTLTDYKGSWQGQSLSYGQSYANPVVLGQVMSENDPDWSVFWDRGASPTSPPDSGNLWVGKMVGEDTDTVRANEVLGVVVIEEGAGSLEGVAYRARLGADTVRGMDNRPPYVYDFSPAFSSTPQVALLSQAAMDSGDGSWAVLYGAAPLSATSLELAVDEDQIGDSERRHNTEQVAYLVLEEAVVYPEPVVADFYATPLSGTVPLTVTFVNSSMGASSYLWDYGDSITNTTSAVTHTHAYTATGVYTVSLTATGPGGSDTLTRTNYITVSSGIVTTTHRVISYTYDSLYRLTEADYSTGELYQYGYDSVGNRLTYSGPDGTKTYVYDAANRLTSVNGVGYTWDDNGNLLNDGVRSYSYDHANRLTSVTSGTLTTGFTYNGAGDRVAKTVGGVTTDYVLDPAAGLTQVLQETTAGQATTYLYGHDLLAQYDSGTWAYHVNDGLGSVRGLADPAGQVVASYRFSPFGAPMGESGGEPYGYTGEQWDASTGLVYLRARYYDPGVGRFVSKDQWGGHEQKPQTLNMFAYVTNNPINQIDPSGYLSDRLIQESLNEYSLDQAFGFQDRWGLLALLRDAEIGDTVTARYLDFSDLLYDVSDAAKWPLKADPRARNGWCIRCGDDNKLRFYNVEDGKERTLPDFIYQLAINAEQIRPLPRNWRPRSVELHWYELNEGKFYDDFRSETEVPDAIAWGVSTDVILVGGNSAVIIDRFGNMYVSASVAVGVSAGMSIRIPEEISLPLTEIGLGAEYWEGYATLPRGLGRMHKDILGESNLKNIIEGPPSVWTGQIFISAALETWNTGSVTWFGVSPSFGGNVSFGWTWHVDRYPALAWDWLLQIPGYDSTVRGSPNLHSDDPRHNCGCQ